MSVRRRSPPEGCPPDHIRRGNGKGYCYTCSQMNSKKRRKPSSSSSSSTSDASASDHAATSGSGRSAKGPARRRAKHTVALPRPADNGSTRSTNTSTSTSTFSVYTPTSPAPAPVPVPPPGAQRMDYIVLAAAYARQEAQRQMFSELQGNIWRDDRQPYVPAPAALVPPNMTAPGPVWPQQQRPPPLSGLRVIHANVLNNTSNNDPYFRRQHLGMATTGVCGPSVNSVAPPTPGSAPSTARQQAAVAGAAFAAPATTFGAVPQQALFGGWNASQHPKQAKAANKKDEKDDEDESEDDDSFDDESDDESENNISAKGKQHTCAKCGYTTDRKSSLDTHRRRGSSACERWKKRHSKMAEHADPEGLIKGTAALTTRDHPVPRRRTSSINTNDEGEDDDGSTSELSSDEESDGSHDSASADSDEDSDENMSEEEEEEDEYEQELGNISDSDEGGLDSQGRLWKYVCKRCKYGASKQDHFLAHKARGRAACKRWLNLQARMAAKSQAGQNFKFVCPHCTFGTDRKDSWKRHVAGGRALCNKWKELQRADRSKIQYGYKHCCSVCGYGTDHKQSFDRHVRTHTAAALPNKLDPLTHTGPSPRKLRKLKGRRESA